MFPRDDGQTIDLSESVEYNALFSELLHVRQSKEETERQESQIKQRLQVALGSATAAVFQQGRITWRKAKDRLVPDLDKLTLEHPEILQQYGKPVLGSRRFLVQPERSAS